MIPQTSLDTVRALHTALSEQYNDCTVFLGECFFHTVEALVEVEEAVNLDPLPLFVLRAFEFAQPTNTEQLDCVLHVGRQVMRQILNDMVEKGLVAMDSESNFRLAENGYRALQDGQVVRRVHVRRVFRFLHPSMAYVGVDDPKGNLLGDLSPSRAPSPWEFDIDTLRQAIGQSTEWKRTHRFPVDIAAVVTKKELEHAAEIARPAVDWEVVTPAMQEPQSDLQHLIVDKAQMATCAFVTHWEDSNVMELSAYPVSAHGKLLRGGERPLFTLDAPDEIQQLIPLHEPQPSLGEAMEGWMQLASQIALPEPELAQVTFDDNSLLITVSDEQIGFWSELISIAMQSELYWHVPWRSMRLLCVISVAGADAAATARIDLLRGILALESDAQRDSIVHDADVMRKWLTEHSLPSASSLRDLAGEAFEFGRYRLAYELAELEDMNDAPV